MSAYEQAVREAVWVQFVAPSGVDEQVFRTMLNRFLAALPPSIVVDGKVVELAVDSDESRDWAPWVTELSRRLALPDLDLAPGWYMNTFGELLDAAREVEK